MQLVTLTYPSGETRQVWVWPTFEAARAVALEINPDGAGEIDGYQPEAAAFLALEHALAGDDLDHLVAALWAAYNRRPMQQDYDTDGEQAVASERLGLLQRTCRHVREQESRLDDGSRNLPPLLF